MIGVRVRGKLKRIYDVGGSINRKQSDSDDQYDKAISAAGNIPVYGQIAQGFSAIGTGIGSQTIDQNGIYKNKASEIVDNSFNPKTHISNIKNLFSGKSDIGSIANTFTGGILGKSVAQKDAQQELEHRRRIEDVQALTEGGLKTGLLNDRASNRNQIYAKFGGAIPINKYVQGGNLKELSEENEQVDGNSHTEGGVQLSPNVEVEGGETINTEGKEPFVFSEKLGFAKLHKPIARAIGKMEKKIPNNITNNTIKLLKEKEQNLKVAQEEFKKRLGIRGVDEYALGGRIKGVTVGSPFNDRFINIDNYLYKKAR